MPEKKRVRSEVTGVKCEMEEQLAGWSLFLAGWNLFLANWSFFLAS